MKVGILHIELYMPESGSLKRKRLIVSGLKEKIRKKFNVSVVEYGFKDKWQRCAIAAACISEEERIISSVFSRILGLLDASRGAYEVLRNEIEIL